MEKDKALTVVDKATGEEITMPSLLQPIESGGTFWNGQNLDIRAMLKDHTGHFSIGGMTNEGKSIEFFLVNAKNFDNIKPSAAYETPSNFTQYIVFVKIGEFYTFATITFGGTSAETARDFISLLQIKGGAVANVVKATIENQTNKKGQKYGVARFELRAAAKEEIQRLKEAISTFPSAMHSFNPLPNIEVA